MIRITKEFKFHMAHAVEGYDGLCSHIHGHEYRLQVTVSGLPDSNGMVLDFKLLKSLVQQKVLGWYDHCLLLKETEKSHGVVQALEEGWGNVHLVPFQPSSENIIMDMAGRLENAFPAGVSLCSLRLYETSSSWVDWFRDESH